MMFIAHQDEVGFEVTNIAADGTVSLRTRGGLLQRYGALHVSLSWPGRYSHSPAEVLERIIYAIAVAP